MVFKILALGGGGSRGILHAGAIKYLEESGILADVTDVYGCSIGAVYGTAVALGLSSEQIAKLSYKFTSFSEIFFGKLTLEKLEKNSEKKGLFEMDMLEEFFVKMYMEETGIDLRTMKIKDTKLPLHICATNLTKKCLTIFEGDVPIVDAIRASCCIPLIFCPQNINGNMYIDGGYLTNVMLDYIPADLKETTLELSIRFEDVAMTPKAVKQMTHLSYLYGLFKVSCLYEMKIKKHKNDVQLYVKLSSGISDVSSEKCTEMIEAGYESTKRFFSESSFQENIESSRVGDPQHSI